MSVVLLTPRNVEEQIMLNLKALLVDTDKHEIKVGIVGGKMNEKAAKRDAKKYARYVYGSKADRKEILAKATQPTDIAMYAAKNEFGSFSENIPSRPFLRTTFSRYKEDINSALDKIMKEFVNQNKDANFFMNKLGLAVAGFVKLNINDGNWAPNSPTTIKRKGSNKPLIDMGAMRQAITSWTVKK
jgi:hypothetical protein